MKFCDQLK